MNEIIVARKAKTIATYIVLMVFGVALIVLGIVMGLGREKDGLIFIGFFGVIGLLIIALGVWQTVKYVKTPTNLITYKDGLYTFADGTTCTPNEITHVLVKLTRQYGVVNSTGGLVITINGTRKIEYQNIAYVQQAQDEMQRISDEYNARLYRETQAAAAENVQTAEPAANAEVSETDGKSEN